MFDCEGVFEVDTGGVVIVLDDEVFVDEDVWEDADVVDVVLLLVVLVVVVDADVVDVVDVFPVPLGVIVAMTGMAVGANVPVNVPWPLTVLLKLHKAWLALRSTVQDMISA